MTEACWEHIALRLDDGTRRDDGGRTLLGGSPLRVLRLSDAGARAVEDLVGGATVGPDRARQQLARRLLDTGLAHPVPLRSPELSVALVVPVRDHADDVCALLDALQRAGELPSEAVVVDDGSTDPASIAAAVGDRARIIRREVPAGPGAARNAGWTATRADLVAFLDADVRPEPGWLAALHAHFVDPSVAAAAPRVRAHGSGSTVLDRYEEHRSPLDLGPVPARVAPRTRVPYVPTACLVVRRRPLAEIHGFDEELRVGEDVDFVWRLAAGGHTVRYEPTAAVRHRNRASWPALLEQRFRYGSSAAALDQRHPGDVAPVQLDPWSMAAWALPVVAGRRGAVAGAATAAATTVALVPKLRGRFDHPVREAVRLAGYGNAGAGRWLAQATSRTWLPFGLIAAATSRRLRRSLGAAVAIPPLLGWRDARPALDPVRWTAASVADDAAYCAGVWWGCWRARSWRVLLPRLARVPGVTTARG